MRSALIAFAAIFLAPAFAWAVPTVQLVYETPTDQGGIDTYLNFSSDGYSGYTKPDSGFRVIQNARESAIENEKKHDYSTIEDLLKALESARMEHMIPLYTLRETEETGRVRGWKCQRYSVLAKGAVVGSLCAAKFKDLGLRENEVANFERRLDALLSASSTKQIQPLRFVADLVRRRRAIPVLWKVKGAITFFGKNLTSNMSYQLAGVRHVDLPPDQFAVPVDYRRLSHFFEMFLLFQ